MRQSCLAISGAGKENGHHQTKTSISHQPSIIPLNEWLKNSFFSIAT
jgi:hypothetical protein